MRTIITLLKKVFTASLPILLLFLLITSCGKEEAPSVKYGLVIHGGAGTIEKDKMPPEIEAQYTEKLNEALLAGYKILADGGTSLDAVEKVINILEDSPLFNAGKGAVFTNNGINELDASIMDGSTLNAGAVARLTHIKNPVSLARLVMEKSEHVFLIGDGAEQFAVQNGIELVDQNYFYTDKSWNALQRALKREQEKSESQTSLPNELLDKKFGTVGAVALDKNGNLAAATSTGGMTNKKYGRAGDVPVIGAGTYANNNTCAVSCTGWGEFFIRLGVAKDVSDLVDYKGMALKDAADKVIYEKVEQLGGDGGLITIDKNGNFATPFNTAGMFRGYIFEDGQPTVKMYKE
jgi:beta-aspartyl-peptidase (threonine type)